MNTLRRADLCADPVEQFRAWLAAAVRAGVREPHAAALGTAASGGRPSARMVLLKSFDERGFVFSTNYESRKARELDENPRACLVFYWIDLERQVRIEGRSHRTSAGESDALHHGRPRGSQLAVWASPQSREIDDDRDPLEQRLDELSRRYGAGAVPRPPFWGGYRIEPDGFEFWQGRSHRLHDRFRYRPADGGGWSIRRLAP